VPSNAEHASANANDCVRDGNRLILPRGKQQSSLYASLGTFSRWLTPNMAESSQRIRD
jgi:hypothetical protein